VTTWSGTTGTAEAYQVSFATLCAGTTSRLLEDAADGPLLDVGAGTGELAARAAAAGLGVVAVDADPAMVAMAAAVVPGQVAHAALPRLPFADHTFASTTANFVVNHVPDPRAAVRELARVTRPGGRVGLTSWTTAPPAWGTLVGEAFAAAGVVPLTGERLPAALDFERSVAGLHGLVEQAGMACVVAEELTWTWEITVDDLWAGISGGVATAGRTHLAQPPAVRVAAERELRRLAGRHVEDGVLRFASTAAYAVGHMPAAP
jgi:SAM-dependent methyltransferase